VWTVSSNPAGPPIQVWNRLRWRFRSETARGASLRKTSGLGDYYSTVLVPPRYLCPWWWQHGAHRGPLRPPALAQAHSRRWVATRARCRPQPLPSPPARLCCPPTSSAALPAMIFVTMMVTSLDSRGETTQRTQGERRRSHFSTMATLRTHRRVLRKAVVVARCVAAGALRLSIGVWTRPTRISRRTVATWK
jgi:hypothetical protein